MQWTCLFMYEQSYLIQAMDISKKGMTLISNQHAATILRCVQNTKTGFEIPIFLRDRISLRRLCSTNQHKLNT